MRARRGIARGSTRNLSGKAAVLMLAEMDLTCSCSATQLDEKHAMSDTGSSAAVPGAGTVRTSRQDAGAQEKVLETHARHSKCTPVQRSAGCQALAAYARRDKELQGACAGSRPHSERGASWRGTGWQARAPAGLRHAGTSRQKRHSAVWTVPTRLVRQRPAAGCSQPANERQKPDGLSSTCAAHTPPHAQ